MPYGNDRDDGAAGFLGCVIVIVAIAVITPVVIILWKIVLTGHA